MLRTIVQMAVLFLAVVSNAPDLAAQSRPAAPVGYLVTYSATNGTKLSDGNSYRIFGVTKNWRTRVEWVDKINSYHRLTPKVIELKSEIEYQAAVQMFNDRDKATQPRPQAPPPMSTVAGTQWQWGGDTMYFDADGTYELVENSRGLASNRRGKWTQSGNTLTLVNDGVWTVTGDKISNGFTTRTKIK